MFHLVLSFLLLVSSYSVFAIAIEKEEVVNLSLNGAVFRLKKKLPRQVNKIEIVTTDRKMKFNIQGNTVHNEDISKNSNKYNKSDMLIIRSTHFNRFTDTDGSRYIVLGALDYSKLESRCYIEVKLLNKFDTKEQKYDYEKSSVAINESMSEILFISSQKFSKNFLVKNNKKRIDFLLAEKVDLITAVSFDTKNSMQMEPEYMEAIKNKKIKIVDSTSNKIPCFFLLLHESKKKLASRLIDAFENHQANSKRAKDDFFSLGNFDTFTKLDDWKSIREKMFSNDVFLKYKLQEYNFNLIKVD